MFGKTPECPCLTLHSKVAISHSINEPVTTPLEMRLEVDTTTGEVAVTRTALDTEQKFRIWKQGLIFVSGTVIVPRSVIVRSGFPLTSVVVWKGKRVAISI
jgi:hypothetical protein